MPSTTINASTPLTRSFSTESAIASMKKQSTSNTFKEVRDEALAGGLFRSFTHLSSHQHSQARVEFENGENEADDDSCGSGLLRGVSCPVTNDSCDEIIEEEKSTNSDDNVNNDVVLAAKSMNVQFQSMNNFASMNNVLNTMNLTMDSLATGPVGPLAGNNSPRMTPTNNQTVNNSMQSALNGQSLAGFQFTSAASCIPLSSVAPFVSLNKPMQAGSQTPSTNTSTPRVETAKPLPVLSQAEMMGMLGGNNTSNDSVVSDECTSSDAGTNYLPNYSTPNIFGSSSSMAIPPPMPFMPMSMGFATPSQVLPVFPPMGAFPGLPLSMLNSLQMGALPGAPLPGSMGAAPAPSMMPMPMPPVFPNHASVGQPLQLQSAIPEEHRASFASMRMSTHSYDAAPAPPAAMHPVPQKGTKGKGKQAPLGPGFSRSPANQITTPEGGKKETARHHFLTRKAKKMSKENGLSVQENYEAIRQEQEGVMAQKMFARSHQRTGNRGAPQQQKGAFYGKGYSKGGW